VNLHRLVEKPVVQLNHTQLPKSAAHQRCFDWRVPAREGLRWRNTQKKGPKTKPRFRPRRQHELVTSPTLPTSVRCPALYAISKQFPLRRRRSRRRSDWRSECRSG
jgi:hypothetical protein